MYTRITTESHREAIHVVTVLAAERLAGVTPRRTLRRTSSRAAGSTAALPRGFRAELGETRLDGEGRLLLGLGSAESLTPQGVRRAGARLVRSLERFEARAATIDLSALRPSRGAAPSAVATNVAAQALGEGLGLGNWRFDEHDGVATNRPLRLPSLAVATSDDSLARPLARGLELAEATNYARRIGALPPNVATPAWFAAEARRLARNTGMSCRVIDFAAARRMGMGGLVNVGQGSAQKPCLIILEHRPKRIAPGARGERIALVGKTLTYDTGGYSLKVNNGMKGMKYDKLGGTAVLGAMKAIAEARLPVHVRAYLPAAENMVSSDSYRPDDIIRMHNGVTVEVTNTDAEGRLVLADALSYACRTFKPTAIVDLATLTGGVVVALGGFSAGLFCNDDRLRERLERAALATGEKTWRLPLWPEHREFMRSAHADLLNSHPKREAHPIQGAAFLSFFVDASIPWAHLDIAGVGNVESATDLFCTGPTGWGVRLLTEAIESFAAGRSSG